MHLDLAAVGGDLAQQNLEQGGLARAVGADDGDAVAAHDAGREILEQHALAERLGQMLGLDHPLARGSAGVHGHRDLALDLAHALGLLGAQIHQLAAASLIARAAGGDAAQQPVLFLLQLLVQSARFVRFLGDDLLGPLVKMGEALVEAADLAVVEPEAALGDPFQEGAVVADDQGGATAGLQLLFQGLDGQDVEVVGRLVEQKNVGVFGEGAGQGRPAGLAA